MTVVKSGMKMVGSSIRGKRGLSTVIELSGSGRQDGVHLGLKVDTSNERARSRTH